MSEDMTLWGVLNEMRLKEELCDVVLRMEVEFKVHKTILCAHSQYFRALFMRGNSSEQMVYTMTNVSPDIMELIIHYMYTQEIRVTIYNVQAVLVMANYLLMRDLVCGCCDFLKVVSTPRLNVQDMNFVRSAASCCVISGLPNVTDYTVAYEDFL